jgi:hypothetical protein
VAPSREFARGGDIDRAIERENAHRHFESLAPDQRNEEIKKYLVDVSKITVDELIIRRSGHRRSH